MLRPTAAYMLAIQSYSANRFLTWLSDARLVLAIFVVIYPLYYCAARAALSGVGRGQTLGTVLSASSNQCLAQLFQGEKQ